MSWAVLRNQLRSPSHHLAHRVARLDSAVEVRTCSIWLVGWKQQHTKRTRSGTKCSPPGEARNFFWNHFW
jgi:hypothetical protein